jgi:hypothetical protein
VLLKYARLVGVPMDVLVDDDLDLPEHLHHVQMNDWVMPQSKMRYGRNR